MAIFKTRAMWAAAYKTAVLLIFSYLVPNFRRRDRQTLVSKPPNWTKRPRGLVGWKSLASKINKSRPYPYISGEGQK
ncbi:hypothetical protein IE4803_PB00409 (plasmid) [Rhizobium etli bv. phaseoli str. IE4803]|nr:hypothetical protein IE4803_PB00409 [Rhizobium etli bv. phaseoli str. IE4803]